MPEHDVFILGAGFSKAINSQMPTMSELTDLVSERLESSGITLPPPLKDPENNSAKEIEKNIELWMTFLSESQPWIETPFIEANRAITGFIRRYIRDVIEERTWASMRTPEVLDDESHSMPQWLPLLVNEWHDRRASVITLNYDTLVERAAERALGHYVDPYYPPYLLMNGSIDSPHLHNQAMNTFTLFKLHGSVNWHYSGRQDFFGEPIYYSEISPWGPRRIQIESSSFLSSRHKEPLIIPPVMQKSTYFNNESIRRLWREASMALEGATRVFVIGYSLPQSDLGMQFFLKQSLSIEGTHWYIVNTDRTLIPRYRKLLEPYQVVSDEYVAESDPITNFVEGYHNELIPNSIEAHLSWLRQMSP